MEYSLCYQTPTGDMIVMLASKIHPQKLPSLALKVGELQAFIPNIRLVVANHEVTTLVFERGNCRLQGDPISIFAGEG